MTDPIQSRLDRVAARLAGAGTDTRALMPADLLALADGLRGRFGASLKYCELPGNPPKGNPEWMRAGVNPVTDCVAPQKPMNHKGTQHES